jgi:hypothetical protein
MFERSELFEAIAELFDRREKRKRESASEVVEGGGSEVRTSRTGSRSKDERIKIKMGRSPSVRGWNTKRDFGGPWEGETGV